MQKARLLLSAETAYTCSAATQVQAPLLKGGRNGRDGGPSCGSRWLHIYTRTAILQYLLSSDASPVTGEILVHKEGYKKHCLAAMFFITLLRAKVSPVTEDNITGLLSTAG